LLRWRPDKLTGRLPQRHLWANAHGLAGEWVALHRPATQAHILPHWCRFLGRRGAEVAACTTGGVREAPRLNPKFREIKIAKPFKEQASFLFLLSGGAALPVEGLDVKLAPHYHVSAGAPAGGAFEAVPGQLPNCPACLAARFRCNFLDVEFRARGNRVLRKQLESRANLARIQPAQVPDF
jgi:hypothetical protein